ncbi:MAG: cupin domain-containing protein [Gammaproteobacteria bacterium]|nr:cupin domain-containing protein [Gammaproteobacteria bacterium]
MFPGNLTAETFLARYWQKKPLLMPQAIPAMRPALTRNELAWLATLDDVESRIVFTDRSRDRMRYRVETGPFDVDSLEALPRRDWTLLVHDVEKHLPAMRRLFRHVPFIPDWRIDDLMISFAAPGGGVGPHRDNYDVFLCQGIGVREWRISTQDMPEDTLASDDLVLLQEFSGSECHVARQGDVLYLPPGVAHWGTAKRACITYSIGMRAPPYYADPDLRLEEVQPGYLSSAAHDRAGRHANRLGCSVTELKPWLQPLAPGQDEITALLVTPAVLGKLRLHGMARLAYDDETLYLNGIARPLEGDERRSIAALCRRRRLDAALAAAFSEKCLRWLLDHGAFEVPEL